MDISNRVVSVPLRGATWCAIAALAVAAGAGKAEASATINFGDDQSISIGLGMRDSFTSAEHGAPDGSRSADFSLDSLRLYVNASLNKYIKGTFDTERASDGTIEVLDGYARFEFMDEINIWVGRMLPPSDRSNLDGPYYLSSWLYPGVVSQYPAKFAGRDDGATIWGKLWDKKIVYSAGVFEGHNRIAGASNEGDNLLYAGRIAINFWDPEDDPAYYTSSTYYGSADILTLAAVIQYEKDGVGTAARKGDYTGFNIDGLFEKKVLEGGAVTLEGAYYHYDTDGVADVAPNFAGAGSTDNVGGLAQGDAYLVSGAFLIPGKVGWGKFQPFARFQEFDADLTKTTAKQYDFGLNYVIDGHNARVSATYAIDQFTGTSDSNKFVLGLQVQF
jgi:hypothetical protein